MKKHFKNIALLALVLVFVLGPVASVFAAEPKYMTVQTYYRDWGGPCAVKYEILVDENDVINFLKNEYTNKRWGDEYANDPTEDGLILRNTKDDYAPKETEWERKEREAMEKQGYYKDGSGVWVKPTLGPDKKTTQVGFPNREIKIAKKGQLLLNKDGTTREAKEGEQYYEWDSAEYSKKRRVETTSSGATKIGENSQEELDWVFSTVKRNSNGRIHSYMDASYVKEGNVTSYVLRTLGYRKDGGPCNYDQTLAGGNQRGKVSNTGGYTYDYNDESDYQTDPITGKLKVDINGNLILKSKLGPKDAVTPQDERLMIFDPKRQIFDTNDVANDGTDNGTILPEYAVPLGFSGAVQKLGAKNNDDVRLAQLVLYIDGISKGLPSKLIDGNMGGMTQRWIMQFQKKHSLGATGLLDTPTQDLMQFYVDELIAGPEFEDQAIEPEVISRTIPQTILQSFKQGLGKIKQGLHGFSQQASGFMASIFKK